MTFSPLLGLASGERGVVGARPDQARAIVFFPLCCSSGAAAAADVSGWLAKLFKLLERT